MAHAVASSAEAEVDPAAAHAARSGAKPEYVRSFRGGLLQLTMFLVGGALVVAGTLALITTSMHRAADRLWNAKTSVRAAHQVEIGLLLHERMSLLGGLTGDPRHEDARRAAFERLHTGLAIEDRVPHETELALRAALDDYLERHDALAATDELPLVQYMLIAPEVDAAIAASEAFIEGARERAHAARAQADRWNATADVVAITVVALLLMIVTTVLVRLRRAYRAFEDVRSAIGAFGFESEDVRAPEVGPRELREIAYRFNRMAHRLSRQRQAQLHFLSAVAHDLRTPLSALRTATTMGLRHDEESAEPARRSFQLVARQVEKLECLVGDLLEVSTTEAGGMRMRLRPCDLGTLVRDTVALFSSTGRGHELALRVPEEPLHVRCDSSRLAQVLNNLVSNAIKYSPEGGRIEVSIEREAQEALVSVSDEGMGMSDEQLEEIFDPFSRLPRSAQSVSGVGMGLWISKRIVDAHGGSIEVESAPDHGSRFTVRLPLGESDARPQSRGAEAGDGPR
jgi:signal transduction histidine kinase